MTVDTRPVPAFTAFAHPERLVSTEWLAEHLGEPGPRRRRVRRGRAALRDRPHRGRRQDRLAHRPQRPGRRATTSTARASPSCSARKGISRDTTVVIYGDKNNWWAAYALWVFTLFGHEDVRLLDGGRAKWEAEGRAYTTDVPTPRRRSTTRSSSATTRPSAPSRRTCSRTSATRSSTCAPPRSTSATAPPHPPTRRRAPCAPATSRAPRTCRGRKAVAEDGTFKPRAELDAIYRDGAGLNDGDNVIAYCRIGERSSHTWFVLTHLLGFEDVRNYDGSWTEWGSAVRVPIVKGAEPGAPCPRAD